MGLYRMPEASQAVVRLEFVLRSDIVDGLLNKCIRGFSLMHTNYARGGFAVTCQLAPHRRPPHPVLVHQLALFMYASFRFRLAPPPLRFSSPSSPTGWTGDFHPPSYRTFSAH